MTEFGTASEVPDADRAEQVPAVLGSPPRPVADREANEADVLEQDFDVPLDEDDIPS